MRLTLAIREKGKWLYLVSASDSPKFKNTYHPNTFKTMEELNGYLDYISIWVNVKGWYIIDTNNEIDRKHWTIIEKLKY